MIEIINWLQIIFIVIVAVILSVIEIANWLQTNFIEIVAVILSVLAVYFQIKQNIWLWIISTVAILIYMYLFYLQNLYALLLLHIYYFGVNVYGFYNWKFGKSNGENYLKVEKIRKKTLFYLSIFFIIVFFCIYLLLNHFNSSSHILLESLVTALSFLASYMLTKKYIEHWIVWIIVDAFGVGLFLIDEMYPTAVLYFILIIMAVIGFRKWKKQLK